MIQWVRLDGNGKYFAIVGGFWVEKLETKKGCKFCIGKMNESLIKFQNEKTLMQFLTV